MSVWIVNEKKVWDFFKLIQALKLETDNNATEIVVRLIKTRSANPN